MPTHQKRDVYAEVTEKIVAALEAGTVPWIKPWKSATDTRHRNGVTGHVYTGINFVLTILDELFNHRTSYQWYTFNQIQTLNSRETAKKAGVRAFVRKGEHGLPLTFYRSYEVEKEDEATGEKYMAQIPILKTFVVFNRDQIDGIDAVQPPPRVEEPSPFEALDHVEAFVCDTGAAVRHGGARAFYRPGTDTIQMPPREDFVDEANYYSVLLHELGHWTGAEGRMDRPLRNFFGTPEYAEEELVAEMFAAFRCAEFGIEGSLRHPEYIASWIKKLNDDHRAIFRAAAAAQKACAFTDQLTGRAVVAEEQEAA